ncbi:hypothetical protein PCI56_17880 [Plesiomonas shigelloides subsp. oncorhynchi]|nr:hypothetical protein [Plesiomonas shigelloides]
MHAILKAVIELFLIVGGTAAMTAVAVIGKVIKIKLVIRDRSSTSGGKRYGRN